MSSQSYRAWHCPGGGLVSRVQLCVTPWTVAHQAPLYMEFSKQEYWSGMPFCFPGDLPDPGIELWFPTLQAVSCVVGRFLTNWAIREALGTVLSAENSAIKSVSGTLDSENKD